MNEWGNFLETNKKATQGVASFSERLSRLVPGLLLQLVGLGDLQRLPWFA